MKEAIDDSCILFEIEQQSDSESQDNYSLLNHTPQSTQQMFDPQAYETHVNNPKSFEKLVRKLVHMSPRQHPSDDEETKEEINTVR
jgi:hypothetical protein